MKLEDFSKILMTGSDRVLDYMYRCNNDKKDIFDARGVSHNLDHYYITIQGNWSRYICGTRAFDSKLNKSDRFVAKVEPCELRPCDIKEYGRHGMLQIVAVNEDRIACYRGYVRTKNLNQFLSINKGGSDFYEGLYLADYCGVFTSIENYYKALRSIYNE